MFFKASNEAKNGYCKNSEEVGTRTNCELEKEVINNKVTTLKEEFFCGSLT